MRIFNLIIQSFVSSKKIWIDILQYLISLISCDFLQFKIVINWLTIAKKKKSEFSENYILPFLFCDEIKKRQLSFYFLFPVGNRVPYFTVSPTFGKDSSVFKHKNVLGYYRNLSSLRYGNEYYVKISTQIWKNPFFPLYWNLFQSGNYNCTWLVRVRWKKRTNPQRWQASQWLYSPP